MFVHDSTWRLHTSCGNDHKAYLLSVKTRSLLSCCLFTMCDSSSADVWTRRAHGFLFIYYSYFYKSKAAVTAGVRFSLVRSSVSISRTQMCHEHLEGGSLHLALTSAAAQRTNSTEFGGQRSKSLRPHKVTQEFIDDILIKSLTEEEEEQSSLWELSGSLILLSVILQHHITSYSRLHHPAVTSHPPA